MKQPVRSAGQTAVIVALYFASAVIAIGTTRFGGGVACVWVATAVLVAALTTSARRSWPWLCGGCFAASVIVTSASGLGPVAALPLGVINVFEAFIGAEILRRFQGRDEARDPIGRLAVLVFGTAIVAPAIAATGGAAIATWTGGGTYGVNWTRWYAGHALGTLTFMPIIAMFMSGAARRALAAATRGQAIESVALLTLVALTTTAVFVQKTMPLSFLPILPVILATFRLGRLGAAISIVGVAIIGGTLTLMGFGPITLMGDDALAHVQFFQFYLAATVMTALPVSADLARREWVYDRLRDSEARYRLLTDNSTDIVMSLHVDGTIRYASPSIVQLGGYDPERVIGHNAIDLILDADQATVAAAHRAALADAEATQIVEFRARVGDGTVRWFEAHSRSVRDANGVAIGLVNTIRDVSHRKSLEAELKNAALTDSLTGLANRRRFDLRMGELQSDGGGGCVAIFDFDHFKDVNDAHGHQGGDRVLQTFATIARACVRDGDLVARLGGEEFGILLPGASIDQARIVCERLRKTVAGTVIAVGDGQAQITVSAGVALLGTDADMGLRSADAALYQAKNDGRNRLNLAA